MARRACPSSHIGQRRRAEPNGAIFTTYADIGPWCGSLRTNVDQTPQLRTVVTELRPVRLRCRQPMQVCVRPYFVAPQLRNAPVRARSCTSHSLSIFALQLEPRIPGPLHSISQQRTPPIPAQARHPQDLDPVPPACGVRHSAASTSMPRRQHASRQGFPHRPTRAWEP